MSKKIKCYFIFIVAIIVSLLCFSIFIVPMAFKSHPVIYATSIKKTLSPSEKTSINEMNSCEILVMGDSLAKGTGDVSGKGFSGYFIDNYKLKSSKTINVKNIAVNGAISSGLLNIVQTSQTKKYIKNSNIIFISIGGNDITQFTTADSTAIADKFNVTKSNYLKNLSLILKTIRSNNTNCKIIFIGLYNPFENYIGDEQLELLNSWNHSTEELLSQYSNSVFIPTYELFKGNLKNYLAMDGFHPNGTGYQAISQKVLQYFYNNEYLPK